MAKKRRFIIDSDILRVIFIFLGSIFSTFVLVFSILAIAAIQKDELTIASRFLLLVFLILGLSRLITYIRDRNKITLIRFIILFTFNVALGILVLFAKDNPYFFALVGGLYCLSIIISRVFKLLLDHSPRSLILNSIIIVFAILLSIGLFIPNEENPVASPVTILCAVVALAAFIEVISNAATQLQAKVLLKIIVRTFALESILGLATMMVGFSLIIELYEPEITNFGDALWHSFAVVTTIGFGDFKIVTPVGRALTAILGLYGIVVVAVITSIIVNFYNETAGKKDKSEIKDIKEEAKEKKKK